MAELPARRRLRERQEAAAAARAAEEAAADLTSAVNHHETSPPKAVDFEDEAGGSIAMMQAARSPVDPYAQRPSSHDYAGEGGGAGDGDDEVDGGEGGGDGEEVDLSRFAGGWADGYGGSQDGDAFEGREADAVADAVDAGGDPGGLFASDGVAPDAGVFSPPGRAPPGYGDDGYSSPGGRGSTHETKSASKTAEVDDDPDFDTYGSPGHSRPNGRGGGDDGDDEDDGVGSGHDAPARYGAEDGADEVEEDEEPAPEPEPEPNESWKAFDTDTEAGRLLRQLYGGRTKPVVNYPKLRTKKRDGPMPAFVPGNGKLGVDNRRSTRVERRVAVPKAKPKSKYDFAAIDFVQRRKAKDVIDAEAKKYDDEMLRYRPLPPRAVATEQEKRRVQNTFQFKGGKALPEAGLAEPIAGELPMSLVTGKVRPHRGSAAASRGVPATKEARRADDLTKVFDSIMGEITERRDFLAEMETMGEATDAMRMETRSAIAKRLKELEKVDAMIKQAEGAATGRA